MCSGIRPPFQRAFYVHQHRRILHGVVVDSGQSDTLFSYSLPIAAVHRQYESITKDCQYHVVPGYVVVEIKMAFKLILVLCSRKHSTLSFGEIQDAGSSVEALRKKRTANLRDVQERQLYFTERTRNHDLPQTLPSERCGNCLHSLQENQASTTSELFLLLYVFT